MTARGGLVREQRECPEARSLPTPPAAPTLAVTFCSNKLRWANLEPLWPSLDPWPGRFPLSPGTPGCPRSFVDHSQSSGPAWAP